MLTKKQQKTLRIELLKRDMSYKDIAKKFYTSKQMVSLAIRGERDSRLALDIRSFVNQVLKEADDQTTDTGDSQLVK